MAHGGEAGQGGQPGQSLSRNLSPKAQDLARNFLSALFMGIRTAQIHEASNRAFERAVFLVRDAADALYQATLGFSIQFVQDFVFVNGTRVRFTGASFDAMQSLRHILEAREVGGIEMRELPKEELIRRLISLCARPSDADAVKTLRHELGSHFGLMGIQQFQDGAGGRTSRVVDRRVFALQAYSKLILAFRDQRAAATAASTQEPRTPRLRVLRTLQDLIELCGDRPDFLARIGHNRTGASRDELHAANVCVLSLLLGHALGLNRRKLVDLGVGALFHDIGRTDATSDSRGTPATAGEAPDASERDEDVTRLIGAVLDNRYRVLEVIGQGGMGTVYKAAQINVAGRPVAIKLLYGALSRKETVIQRFENEARIIGQLRHPNTLKLLDSGRLPDGRLYLVTELLTGRSLEALLTRGAIPPRRALGIVKQIASALAEAHAHGIVHRDLKPGNVFLEIVGDQEIAKVLDFGIAKVVSGGVDLAQTGPMQVIGSPAYMSPEQVSGTPIDGRSDLYSLGVLLYQCLTGRLPFHAETPVAMALKHVRETPPRLAELNPPAVVDPTVEAVVMALLAKEPARRPQNARTLHAWIDKLESTLPADSDAALSFEQQSSDLMALGTKDFVIARHPEERPHVASPPHVHASFARLLDACGVTSNGLVRALIAAEHHVVPDEEHAWGDPREAPRLLSRIVSVAEAYDALGSGLGTDTGAPMDPPDALQVLVGNPRNRFDPRLVDLLMNVLRVFPIGTEVILDSGEIATVSTHLGGLRWDRPVVWVGNDQSRQLDLMLEEGGRFHARILGSTRFLRSS